MKKFTIICLAVLLPVFIPACSGSSRDSAAAMPQATAMADQYMEEAQYEAPAPMMEAGSSYDAPMLTSGRYEGESWSDPAQPEKIIKTGNVDLSTDHFDNDKIRLETLTQQMGGFIERSNIYGTDGSRRYEAVLRIPGDRFSDMKKAVEDTGSLISTSESTEDVTGRYYDTVERLATKRVEEERVLDMIDKAETVETLLTLEDYLGRIRTDIYLMESQIKDIDSLSSYSTLNVTMTENLNVVLMANTGNYGQKLWQGFKSSAIGTASFFGNILIFLAGAVIPLALIALVAAAGFMAYTKLYLKTRKEGAGQ